MPRVSNANPTPYTHSFHERAVKVVKEDRRRVEKTALFAADCFLAPVAFSRSSARGSTIAGIAISPFSTALGIATCVVGVPPVMVRLGVDTLIAKLSE